MSREASPFWLISTNLVLTKELSDVHLCGLALRRFEDEIDQLIVTDGQSVIVDLQKQECRFQTNSLVAINERMILNQMEQIGGSHRADIFVQILAAILRHRLSQCRFQQTQVSNPLGAPIDADLFAMGLHDVVQSQELEHRGYSASFLNALA